MTLFTFKNSQINNVVFILEPDAIELKLAPNDEVKLIWKNYQPLDKFYEENSSLFTIDYFERSIVIYHNYYSDITISIFWNDELYYTT
jgi:hypothetical protein